MSLMLVELDRRLRGAGGGLRVVALNKVIKIMSDLSHVDHLAVAGAVFHDAVLAEIKRTNETYEMASERMVKTLVMANGLFDSIQEMVYRS